MAEFRDVTPDEITRVCDGVVQIIADALARDVDGVRLHSRLIDDLGAESIDFLDIVFRLEQRFHIEIPRGRILEEARGELAEEEFAADGRLTAAGAARLRAYLSEIPAQRFAAGMRVAEVPRLFTVETFCKVVARAVTP